MSRPAESDAPRKLRALTRLVPYLRPYRGLLAGWLGFLVVSSTATLVLPQAVRVMIDNGFVRANPAAINAAFLGLFAVAAVLAIATAARFFFVTLLGERVVADLRRRLYERLLTFDQTFYESTRTGELVSRLAADTELVQTVVGSTLSLALRSVVTLLGGVAAMVWTSPRLAGLTLLVIPAVVLPIVVFGRRVARLSRTSQDCIADASAIAGETIGAMHTVQAYTREASEAERYAAAVLRALAAARRRIAMTGSLTALVILLVFGAITLVLWAGAKAVMAGTMAPGVLSQFVLYAVLAAGSVGTLSEVWGQVLRAAGALGRIGELLDLQATIASPALPQALPRPVHGALRFEHVRFHYPSRPDRAALADFTLEVRPGETIALVGPSGAGKTTVFQLLLRFHDPAQGRITLDGVDLRALALPELRGSFALVPQDAVLFGASAADNIGFGRDGASRDAIIAAARAAEADAFIRAMPEGYDTYLGERGVRLSGGQQQRIAIARALLRDAPVLLLDEATSSLDAQSEHLIQQAVDRLKAGRTTLVIAHRLATVQGADRIVVMDAGQIVAQGTHAELVAAGGLYAELARLQFAA
ncbi:MAG: ATP-binding cassette domain-containing protein [Dokdonella sp.]|uniref:ABC transporter transmembrane domain-containing protein n=1 Tax=Dokdonella sp. TaxID=2291710 RepID=UPI0025C1A2FF|nr:ABC transporter transmembrane domain-containing protein [Dokdonella sp.]MBX3699974.1 ATP-binding cassette domain-containing protein [Dokdonella sp.]MCW5578400.1 ATP-binding cassette domain-containing protein [Dokdonella sp.]